MATSPSDLAKTQPLHGGVNVGVRPGQILEGKFRIERIIGEGAMGLVVEATHVELEERVALKFLREEAKHRPEITSRFAREARSAATIKNDHVARVYDVGTHEGAPFIVMEYLQGQDLEQVLNDKGAIDRTSAVEYVIQACEGLTAAHAQGIVHRDIKPGNLFVIEQGGLPEIKVLDFGISKAGVKKGSLEDIDLVTGDTTQIMGSPHYMSPEQIRSTKDVDSRADIWSLGIVLFELIANTPPFDGGDVTALIAQVLHEPHRPLRSLVPDVPPGLEAVIDHCLQKDPARRYQHAADLAVALLPFAPKRSRAVAERATTLMARSTGRAIAPDSLPPPALPSSQPSSGRVPAFVPVTSRVPPPSAPVKQRSIMPWIALIAIVLGLGGGAFALFSRMQKTPLPSEVVTTTPPVAPPTMTASVAPPAVPSAVPEPVESSKPATNTRKPVAAPVIVAPRQRPQPSASAIAPPPRNPESEIRHER